MRRLQWLKTRTGLFSDPRMLCLMNQANGDSYIVLWFFLKDMAGTVNDNGLVYVSGQEAMTTQLIAKCLHRRRPFIEKGLTLLEKLELIERDKSGLIRIAIWDELQDFQRDEKKREQTKERVRRYRERQRQAQREDSSVDAAPVMTATSASDEMAMTAEEAPVYDGEPVTMPKVMRDYASVQKYQKLFGPMQGEFAQQLIDLEMAWGSEATCIAIELAHENGVNNIKYIQAILKNSNGRPMKKEDAYARNQREYYEHLDAVLHEARREKLQRLQAEDARRMLPETMTAQQAESLLHRLLKRCKFEPSIAEVMEEWYAIVRENRRPQIFQAGPAQTVPQRHINRLKDTRNALLEGRPIEGMNLSEKLIRFARSFFPEISLSVIERNQLEISNCMTDRQKDLERKDGYMTYMKLDKRGVITLYMSKIQ